MALPKPGEDTSRRFDRLAEDFVARGATRGQMFGMPILKWKGKVFCGTFGDAMTFKLGPEDLERARRAKGVEPFEAIRAARCANGCSSRSSTLAAGNTLAEGAFAYLSS